MFSLKTSHYVGDSLSLLFLVSVFKAPPLCSYCVVYLSINLDGSSSRKRLRLTTKRNPTRFPALLGGFFSDLMRLRGPGAQSKDRREAWPKNTQSQAEFLRETFPKDPPGAAVYITAAISLATGGKSR